ncbi:protein of unknown function DUF1488, partial [Burkholderia sp. BT03]
GHVCGQARRPFDLPLRCVAGTRPDQCREADKVAGRVRRLGQRIVGYGPAPGEAQGDHSNPTTPQRNVGSGNGCAGYTRRDLLTFSLRFSWCRPYDRRQCIEHPWRASIVEALDLEPSVATDGRSVVFVLSLGGRNIACVVTLEALEQHFWLQSGATEARVLKAFSDGCRRIMAVAERKVRARPGAQIVLTADDFGPRA